MPKCPCCAEKLLRHIRHGEIYWFCSHCWQEMPDLAAKMVDRSSESAAKSKAAIAVVPRRRTPNRLTRRPTSRAAE